MAESAAWEGAMRHQRSARPKFVATSASGVRHAEAVLGVLLGFGGGDKKADDERQADEQTHRTCAHDDDPPQPFQPLPLFRRKEGFVSQIAASSGTFCSTGRSFIMSTNAIANSWSHWVPAPSLKISNACSLGMPGR